MQKSTEAEIDVSDDVGLEVNEQKTKYKDCLFTRMQEKS
jgi:hypothetical protein